MAETIEIKVAGLGQIGYVADSVTTRKGVIKEVHIEDELLPLIISKHMGENKGIRIEQPMKHKAGILIMKFESYEHMMDVLGRFSELAWIELED